MSSGGSLVFTENVSDFLDHVRYISRSIATKVKDIQCNFITTVKGEKNQTSSRKNTMRGLDFFMISVFSSSGFYLRSLTNTKGKNGVYRRNKTEQMLAFQTKRKRKRVPDGYPSN
jgi:hypothetical protein